MVVLAERNKLKLAAALDIHKKMGFHSQKKQATCFRRSRMLLSHMVNESETNMR